jgi:hypothetical protein
MMIRYGPAGKIKNSGEITFSFRDKPDVHYQRMNAVQSQSCKLTKTGWNQAAFAPRHSELPLPRTA